MRPGRVWVTADTHFGHTNILKFEAEYRGHATIQEHDRDLLARWNAVVKPQDTVWHLGDVFFGKDGHEILAGLHGFKRLVMGNHDRFPLQIYQRYFERIYGVAQYDGCVLSHIPVHPNQMAKRYRLNIHGHLHHRSLEDPRYRCVSVERTGLTPVLLRGVIASLSD